MLIIIIGGFAKEKCGLFAEQVHRRIYPVKTSCLLFSKFFWLQFSLPIYSFVLAAKTIISYTRTMFMVLSFMAEPLREFSRVTYGHNLIGHRDA